MSNHTRRPSSPADRMFNAIVVIVIAVVLGLGIYAVYGKIGANIEELRNKAMESGETAQTVKYLADQSGMTFEEFIGEYGLTDTDVTEKTLASDLVDYLTVENFAKLNGKELDAFLEEYGLTDKVSADMKWTEAQNLVPTGKNVTDEQLAQMKELGGLDESITAETPWGEAKDSVEKAMTEVQRKQMSATPAPTEKEAADETETKEVPVEDAD